MKLKLRVSRTTVFALLFALCPFLSYYVIPLTKFNLTVGLFMLVFLVEFARMLWRPQKLLLKRFYGNRLFYITFIFVVLNHFNVLIFNPTAHHSPYAVKDIFLLFIEMLGIILFFSEDNAIKVFRKYTENIALFMGIIVILECVAWYGLHFFPAGKDTQLTLPFISEEAKKGVSQILSNTGLFRPCAFFLEPAHFSRYATVALSSMLFSENKKPINFRTVTLSLSILLTLSGFGIMLVALVWSIYYMIGSGRFTAKAVRRGLFFIIVAMVLVAGLYATSPSFRSALGRFTGAEGDNGVYGRMGNYYYFIQNMKGFSRAFGMGYKNLPYQEAKQSTYYFTGILEMMYCQGIAGTLLFICLYVAMLMDIYRHKDMLAFVVATISLVFFIGSTFFSALSMLIYIPFLFKRGQGTLLRKGIGSD